MRQRQPPHAEAQNVKMQFESCDSSALDGFKRWVRAGQRQGSGWGRIDHANRGWEFAQIFFFGF
jgi:hypothetical protein